VGLGDSLRKWATSEATQLLTADGQQRSDAAATADSAERQATSDVGEQLLRSAFPKVGEWADRQKAAEAARELARDEKEREEIAALPMAAVRLSVAGDYATGQWAGQLHLAWKELEPERPDPDNPSSDPYSTRPGVCVELFTGDGTAPVFGDHAMARWSFQIPGYTGDGSYDLTAIAHEREPAALTYEEWTIDFSDSEGASAYFFADAGQSTVTVSDGARTVSATIAMSGELGALTATGTITRA
jgi:hypothetical protein